MRAGRDGVPRALPGAGRPASPRAPAAHAHAQRATRAAGGGVRGVGWGGGGWPSSSSLPFSSGPPVPASGGAAGSSRPASGRRHGARRPPTPPGSARLGWGRRSHGEDRVSSTPAGPPGALASAACPATYTRPRLPPQALPLLPLGGRFLPSFAPRLHEQDNMAPTGAHPEVKRVTALTLAWDTRAPLAAIFAAG